MTAHVDAEAAVPSALAIAVAGSGAVATAFGMARYGYGLLLPDIQDDLALGVGALGVIGTLAYASYLVATALVSRCVERVGARATVVIGGLLAVVGTIVVASAAGPVLLGTGVAIAGASAGLVYAPFGEAVQRLPSLVRARTLATINCGTGWGVAAAAPIAVLTGDGWRAAYVGFAGCAALSTIVAARTLPGRRAGPAETARSLVAPRRPTPAQAARPDHRGLRRSAWPMVAAALLVGLGSATFWTFGVDQVRGAGLDQTAGRVFLGVAGLSSLTGLAAGDVINRLGARLTFVLTALIEAATIATIAVAPNNLIAVLVAAACFGAAYNTIVAVTVLWSTRIYTDRPSAGVATATGAQGIGLLAGPLTAGLVAETTSLTTALLAGAAILACTTALAPRGDVIHDAHPTH